MKVLFLLIVTILTVNSHNNIMKDYRPGELLAEHILNCTKDWIYS